MFTLVTPFASLSYRVVTDDDLDDVDDAAGVGGIVITGLQSIKPGEASKLLAELVALHPSVRMAVIAYAASIDHERLYALYGRFGFSQTGRYASLRVRN
jgi:hypothetical protein